MAGIVTLTLNPAIDHHASVPNVVPERKLRCGEPESEPGGGGVNVARAIRKLGSTATAIFPAGGSTGALLQQLLAQEGVPHVAVPIGGETRRNWNIRETATDRLFRFCTPGPELSPAELQACLDGMDDALVDAGYAVVSGSLPPGVPPETVARAAALARARGARLFLDTSGPALAGALEEGVWLVKPSLNEFRELTGASDEHGFLRAGARLIERRRCEVLVLSLGPAGVLWMDGSHQERLSSPAVRVASAIGAGDSLVGGIVVALSRGRPIDEAVRYGVAAGAASVMNSGTQLCRREDVERLFPLVAAATTAAVGREVASEV